MPETIESTRKWSGYVCPDCRFIFRVASDHDGSGLVCPNCRRVLRIPHLGETLPPLIVPLPQSAAPVHLKRHRRRRSRHGSSGHWEHAPDDSPHRSHADARQMRWMLAAGALVLVLCLAVVIRAMRDGSPSTATPAAVAAVPAVPPEPAVTAITDAAFLAAAQPLAERFLNATRVDELLPLVREPERAATRLHAYHGGDSIEPEGLHLFNTRSEVGREGPFLYVQLSNRAFEEKTMAFVNTPDGLKIDWESWVGWSATPWPDFIESKPTSPTLFRVLLQPVDYYNFAFTDDLKWRSFLLMSPDGEHTLYGYVERGTLLAARIEPAPEVRKSALTLRLRFPDDGESRNQVLIDSIAADHWFIENEDTP